MLLKRILGVLLLTASAYGFFHALAVVPAFGETSLGLLLFSGLGALAGIGCLVPDDFVQVRQDAAPEAGSEQPPMRIDMDTPQIPDEDLPASISVIENIERVYIDEVVPLLEADDRVEGFFFESGRHYSVPDRDDLPEWFAYRIQCRRGNCDALMEDLREQVGGDLEVRRFT